MCYKDSRSVLFIIYDLERGGPELRLLDFSRYFPRDIDMHICVTSDKLSLLPLFKKNNSNILIVPIRKAYLEVNKICIIYKYVKLNKISILNSFDLKDILIAAIIKLISRERIKLVYHSVNLLHRLNGHQKFFLGLLVRYADSVLCNTQESKRLMKGLGIRKSRISVIYNGVDPEYFKNIGQEDKHSASFYSLESQNIVMGTIANFVSVKNYPFLLKGFRLLLKRYSRLRLMCVGGGVHQHRMERLARDLGLEHAVSFSGYSDNVLAHLSFMDIFVLCSLHEGLPNALLQAMSMGLPVICSEIGGCKEVIKDRVNGILFPPNDLGRFIVAVELVINDRRFGSRLGRRARRTVKKNFSLNSMIENYANFYRNL